MSEWQEVNDDGLAVLLAKIYAFFSGILGFLLIATVVILRLFWWEEAIIPPPLSANLQSAVQGAFVAGVFADPRQGTAESQSAVQGAFVAGAFAEPRHPQITTAETGIRVAGVFAEEIAPLTDEAFVAVRTLKKITAALETDVQKEFLQNVDRGKALDQHLTYLRTLEQEGQKNLATVTERRATAEAQYNAATVAANDKQEAFFAALNSFDAARSETLLTEFKAEKRKVGDSRADLGTFLALEERLSFVLPQLSERIAAIEKNRRQLVLGLACEI